MKVLRAGPAPLTLVSLGAGPTSRQMNLLLNQKLMSRRWVDHSASGGPDTFTVTDREGKRTLHVGRRYVIRPRNPSKLRNRDRECLVLAFVPVSDTHPDIVAKVRFLDNNRVGRAEPSELRPL